MKQKIDYIKPYKWEVVVKSINKLMDKFVNDKRDTDSFYLRPEKENLKLTDEEYKTYCDMIHKENKYFATIVNDGLNENGSLDTSSFNFQGVGIADTIDYNI